MVLIKWSLLYVSASYDVWDEDNVEHLISVPVAGPRLVFVGPEVCAVCLGGYFVPAHFFFKLKYRNVKTAFHVNSLPLPDPWC